MIVSLSNVSPGRAVRKRRMPARSGDCTSDLKRASRSGTSGRDPSRARRAANVTSSTDGLSLRSGWCAVDLRLVLLDEVLHADRIGLAVAVTGHRRGAAAGLDDDVGEEQVGINAHGSHVDNMYRLFFSAE